MNNTTLEIVRSALRADPSVTPSDRTRLLALLRNGKVQTPPNSSPVPTAPPGIVRPGAVARRLGRSVRSVHLLCRQGLLEKIKFPGRQRCAGITSQSLEALLSTNEARSINGGA